MSRFPFNILVPKLTTTYRGSISTDQTKKKIVSGPAGGCNCGQSGGAIFFFGFFFGLVGKYCNFFKKKKKKKKKKVPSRPFF